MNSPAQPSYRRVGPPKALRWIIIGASFLGGPGAFALGGMELYRRHSEMSGQATATVIEHVEREGSNPGKIYCPVFQWEHEGETVEVEGPCERSTDVAEVGAKVAIRFTPNDIQDARPDGFWSLYGEMIIPIGIAGTLFSAFFFYLVFARRRKPPAVG